MEHIQKIGVKMNEKLKDIKHLDEFEKRTGLPRSTVAMAFLIVFSIFLVFNYAGSLISNFIGWSYPGY